MLPYKVCGCQCSTLHGFADSCCAHHRKTCTAKKSKLILHVLLLSKDHKSKGSSIKQTAWFWLLLIEIVFISIYILFQQHESNPQFQFKYFFCQHQSNCAEEPFRTPHWDSDFVGCCLTSCDIHPQASEVNKFKSKSKTITSSKHSHVTFKSFIVFS